MKMYQMHQCVIYPYAYFETHVITDIFKQIVSN